MPINTIYLLLTAWSVIKNIHTKQYTCCLQLDRLLKTYTYKTLDYKFQLLESTLKTWGHNEAWRHYTNISKAIGDLLTSNVRKQLIESSNLNINIRQDYKHKCNQNILRNFNTNTSKEIMRDFKYEFQQKFMRDFKYECQQKNHTFSHSAEI